MTEEKILIEIGLTQTEAKIYLACLELGQDTVLHIAKKADIKRPTCYVALDNLIEKGYVIKIEKSHTTEYAAEEPTILLNKYKAKIANFKELLPVYEAKYNRGSKPKIKFYEGKEAVGDVYTNIIFQPPMDEIYFYGADVKKLLNIWPNLFNKFSNVHAQHFKTVMEIVSYDDAGIAYAQENHSKRPIRTMPKHLPVFADSVITNNKLFIVSLNPIFGILIESEDLAKTYKNFFLLAWQAAEEVK